MIWEPAWTTGWGTWPRCRRWRRCGRWAVLGCPQPASVEHPRTPAIVDQKTGGRLDSLTRRVDLRHAPADDSRVEPGRLRPLICSAPGVRTVPASGQAASVRRCRPTSMGAIGFRLLATNALSRAAASDGVSATSAARLAVEDPGSGRRGSSLRSGRIAFEDARESQTPWRPPSSRTAARWTRRIADLDGVSHPWPAVERLPRW